MVRQECEEVCDGLVRTLSGMGREVNWGKGGRGENMKRVKKRWVNKEQLRTSEKCWARLVQCCLV